MLIRKETHEFIYQEILKDIYTDKDLCSLLGFKGGTAAYLFYNLPRFSVDLDFDLLDAEKTDLVFQRIEEIAKKYGEIKEIYKKHFTLFFQLSYGKEDHNIKIEISRRNADSKFSLQSYFGISMLVMEKDDMFANKLLAMVNRLGKSNRDIFDVWFFAKNNWPINSKLIESKVGTTFKEYLQDCISKLEKYPSKYILDGLGQLLNESQKDWANAKLKEETIYYLNLLSKNS